MAKRVLLGKISSGVYGLRISRKGVDVTTASGKDLLFDSTTNSGLGRYFRKFSSATGVAGFNNFIPISGGTADTENVSGTEYHPLFLYLQDGTGIQYDASGTTYYDPTNTANRVPDAQGTQPTSDDVIITGTSTTSRVQERLDMFAFNSGADTNLGNPAPINSTRHAGFPVTFTGNATDHGTNMRYFAPASTANQQYSSNTVGGYGKRLEYRILNGQSLNSRFIYGDTSESWYYTLDRTRMGGNPPTNVKVGVFRIPCGYGYMTSTYMGF
jgi:hypothetical protein